MARRPRQRAKFRLANLREVLTQCTDMLYKAISKQNPDLDPDDVEDGLRLLARQLGGGPSQEATPVETPASYADDKPEYNLAADVLVLAFSEHQNGNYRDAFKLFSTAVEADGAAEFFEGVAAMNADSTLTQVAAALSEEDDDDDIEDDDPALEDEIAEEVAAELEDDLDIGDDDDDDPLAPDDVMDSIEVDSEYEDDEEEIDDSDDSDSSVPMSSASSKTTAQMKRALANKASLSGTRADREKAAKVFK